MCVCVCAGVCVRTRARAHAKDPTSHMCDISLSALLMAKSGPDSLEKAYVDSLKSNMVIFGNSDSDQIQI